MNKMTLYRFILYHAVLQNSLFLLFYCYFLYLHNRYCVASILFVLCIFFCKSIIKLNQNLEPVSQIQFGLFNETCHSTEASCSSQLQLASVQLLNEVQGLTHPTCARDLTLESVTQRGSTMDLLVSGFPPDFRT